MKKNNAKKNTVNKTSNIVKLNVSAIPENIRFNFAKFNIQRQKEIKEFENILFRLIPSKQENMLPKIELIKPEIECLNAFYNSKKEAYMQNPLKNEKDFIGNEIAEYQNRIFTELNTNSDPDEIRIDIWTYYIENYLMKKKLNKIKIKTEQETPKTFEGLFYNPEHAEHCLKILNELQPPVIDAINNYIGKAKGIFPLWIKVLKNHKPEPLIKHFKDTVYKDLLNNKVNGLNLSKDASEFRKQYVRVENDKIELDIKTLLSQYSQNGKLGK